MSTADDDMRDRHAREPNAFLAAIARAGAEEARENWEEMTDEQKLFVMKVEADMMMRQTWRAKDR
jgi:hypothetical protein